MLSICQQFKYLIEIIVLNSSRDGLDLSLELLRNILAFLLISAAIQEND